MRFIASCKTVSFVALLAFSALLVGACGEGAGESPDSTAPDVVEVPTRWASANARDLSSLVSSSDEVFFARVDALTKVRDETILPGADSQVPGKAGRAASTLPISVYELIITRPLGGERSAGSTVTFEQVGGVVDQGGEAVRLMLDGDPPVEVGKEYLFFVSRKPNGTLSAPPYGRLEVANGRLSPVSRWAGLGALQELSQITAAEAEREIDAGR